MGGMFQRAFSSLLPVDTGNRYHTHPRYMPFPAKHVSLRGIEEERYTVVDISRLGQPGGTAKVLEEVEVSRALFETYEGAVASARFILTRPHPH